jgi:hypothetical protein
MIDAFILVLLAVIVLVMIVSASGKPQFEIGDKVQADTKGACIVGYVHEFISHSECMRMFNTYEPHVAIMSNNKLYHAPIRSVTKVT